METPVINYPFGAADVQSKSYAATIAATISNQKTIVKIGELTGALTLNATLAAELRAGAELVVVLDVDATPRTVTLGTGFEAQAIDLPANTKRALDFTFDGTKFQVSGLIEREIVEEADLQAKNYAATIAVSVAEQNTIVEIAELTEAATINLTIAASVKKGARLLITTDTDASNRAVTLGTGTDGKVITTTANKVGKFDLTYNGTAFLLTNYFEV